MLISSKIKLFVLEFRTTSDKINVITIYSSSVLKYTLQGLYTSSPVYPFYIFSFSADSD